MIRIKNTISKRSVNALLRKSSKKYYVYALCYNKFPFYIGKGCGARIFSHERFSRARFNDFKEKQVNKAIEENKLGYFIFIFTNEESKAFELEKKYIDRYGFVWEGGQLCNLSCGGEGYAPSNWTKEKHKQTLKDNPEIMKEASRKRLKTLKDNPELKLKATETLKKTYQDNPEIMEQISKTLKQTYKENPEILKIQVRKFRKVFKDNPEIMKNRDKKTK